MDGPLAAEANAAAVPIVPVPVGFGVEPGCVWLVPSLLIKGFSTWFLGPGVAAPGTVTLLFLTRTHGWTAQSIRSLFLLGLARNCTRAQCGRSPGRPHAEGAEVESGRE